MDRFFQWPRPIDIDYSLSNEEQGCVSFYRRRDVFKICVDRNENDDSGGTGHVAIYVKDPTAEDGYDVLMHYDVGINDANDQLESFLEYVEGGDAADVSEEED